MVAMQTQQDASIDAAVLSLLRTIPRTWAARTADSLTHAEEKALVALTAAGLVERRLTLRLRMHGDDDALRCTIVATGACGLEVAIEQIAAAAFARWEKEWKRHRESTDRDAPKLFCERIGLGEWRLTDTGVLAQEDAVSAGERRVLDWVLWRGCFDGRERLRGDGSMFQRKPLTGEGRLESLEFERISPPTVMQSGVRIENWDEGAVAFRKLFEAFYRTEKSPSQVVGETFSPADIREALDTSGPTLAKYADAAQVRRPGRGGHNHLYTRDEYRRILVAMATGTGDVKLKAKARSLLAVLDLGNKTQVKAKKQS